jgi:hypothetical protein
MPADSVAIALEGVIQKGSTTAPLPLGITLYHSLSSNFNILLYSEQDRKSVDYWLTIEALNKHAAVEYNEDSRIWNTSPGRKVNQLNSLRQRGYHISLVIEPDPTASEMMINNGFSVMTFTHSQYALPQWRPDYAIERPSWQGFVDAAYKIAELKALNEKLKLPDDGRDH